MISYITIKRVLSLSVTVFFLALTIGCSENGSITSFEEENSAATTKFDNIASKRVKSMDLSATVEFSDQPEYPQSVSCIASFKNAKDNYNGGACQLPNKSSFSFSNGALKPPPDHPWGEPVIITMMAEKDPLTNEIIFTFGPSGCVFETPAEVWLNWSDLNSPSARLFYLDEDGNRLEELPEQIDVFNKQMCIRINHFSRYAVAYSN